MSEKMTYAVIIMGIMTILVCVAVIGKVAYQAVGCS